MAYGPVGTPDLRNVASPAEQGLHEAVALRLRDLAVTIRAHRWVPLEVRRDERLGLINRQAQLLAGRAGKGIVLGIRPEAMALEAQGPFAGTDNTLPVQIAVVEPLGEKMDLYTTTQNHPHVVARVDARRGIEAGQNVTLYVDVQKVHVFEPGDEGLNLSLAQTAEATA